MRLGKRYTPQRLEKACERAVAIGAYTFKNVESILKNGLDQQPLIPTRQSPGRRSPKYQRARIITSTRRIAHADATDAGQAARYETASPWPTPFLEQLGQPDLAELSFEDRFAMLVDRQWTFKEDRRMTRLLRTAKLRDSACIENIDFKTPRALDKSLLVRLSGSDWIKKAQNAIICGPTGVGKTYLACAIANSACRNGFAAMYKRAPRLVPGGCHRPGRWLLSQTDEQVIKDQGLDHR